MAETERIAANTATDAEVTPSMDTSPPLSEKTVVAFPQAAPPPPEPLSEPSSEPQKVDEQLPMPHLKLALFSTHGGQREPRELTTPAYYPPVIVHSGGIEDVLKSAAHWRKQLPKQYHCIFPGCGYHITDFWDAHDIHSETPQFLEKVLDYIQHQNLYFARQSAVAWASQNRERLSVVASDDIYDPKNPISCVDKIFTDRDKEQCPRPFLWHVANIMRTGMLNAVAKQQAAETAANAGEAGKAVGSDGRKYDPKAKVRPVAEKKANVAAEEKQPKPGLFPGSGPQMLGQPPLAVPGSNQFPPEGYPHLPRNAVMPPRPVPPPHVGISMGPPIVSSPPVNPAVLRNTKGRNARQRSGSNNQSMGHHGWAENVQYGQHPRQLSGGLPNMQPLPFHGPPPIGQHPINPLTGLPPFPPNAVMPSPPMPPTLPYMPGPPGMMHPPGMFGGPHMGPMPASFPPGGPIRGDIPMGDMTNNGRFPPDVNDSRMGPRPPMNRRSSRGLYNPYGSERPDFTNIPAQPSGRKTSRSSFSNGARNRKVSLGSQNRPNNFASYDIHPAAPNAPRFNSHPIDHPYSTNAPPDLPVAGETDPTVINDRLRGCDEMWIGPENDFVTHLIMFNIAEETNDGDLRNFFGRVGPFPSKIFMNEDRNKHLLAYVHFQTPADVANALRLDREILHGKSVSLKVPRFFYSFPKKPGLTPPYYAAMTNTSRQPPQGHQFQRRMSEAQQGHDLNMEAFEPPKPASYSPQDARSDLPILNEAAPQQKAAETMATVGSPETRKVQKKSRSPKKKGETIVEKTSEEREIPEMDLEEQRRNKGQAGPTEVVKDTLDETQPSAAPAVEVSASVEDDEVVSAQKDDITTTALPHPVEAEMAHQPEIQQRGFAPSAELASLAQDSDSTEVIIIAPETSTEVPTVAIENNLQTPSDVQSPLQVPLESDLPGEKLNAESIGLDKHSTEDSPPVDHPTHTTKVEDVVSDEALAEEEPSSFLSAKESQSENEKQEPIVEDVPSKEENLAEEMEPVPTTVPTASTVPIAEQSKEAESAALVTASEIKDVEAAGTVEGTAKESTPLLAVPHGPASKKGASRTESLSVFGKSKSEARKEKAAKKKEKKKTKSQKSGPASKALSASMVPTASSSGTASQTPSVPTSRKPSIAEGLNSTETVNNKKIKAEEHSHVHTANDVPGMTQGSESDHNVPLGATQQATLNVPSSDNNTQHATTIATTAEEARQKSKKSEIKVAVPNISFTARSSSPKSSGDSSPTATMKTPTDGDTSPRGTGSLASSHFAVSNSMSPGLDSGADNEAPEASSVTKEKKTTTPASPVDNASVTSSSTVKDQNISPPSSPSPTTDAFVTPLQTPSALTTFDQQQSAQAKKAQKKREQRKKKKEKVAAETDAFTEQMNQIAFLRTAKASTSRQSYYDQARDDNSSTSTKTSAEQLEKDQRVSILQDIQDYAREKALALDGALKVPLPVGAPNEAAYARPLSFADVEKLLDERQVPNLGERLMGGNGKVPKAGTIPFFQQEELGEGVLGR